MLPSSGHAVSSHAPLLTAWALVSSVHVSLCSRSVLCSSFSTSFLQHCLLVLGGHPGRPSLASLYIMTATPSLGASLLMACPQEASGAACVVSCPMGASLGHTSVAQLCHPMCVRAFLGPSRIPATLMLSLPQTLLRPQDGTRLTCLCRCDLGLLLMGTSASSISSPTQSASRPRLPLRLSSSLLLIACSVYYSPVSV